MSQTSHRTSAIILIVVVNGIAAILHLTFWLAAFVKLQAPSPGVAPAAIPTIYGFGLADLLWSAPFLAASAVGLWRGRFWGWLLAQWCNVLYWYSLSVVLVRDLLAGSLSPGGILFLPFTLFAFWAASHLWVERRAFFD